jgi:TolB-like protein/Tfp pilus assembly protein PilF
MNRNCMEPQELCRDLLRSQVDKILASPGFANAGRLGRFLRFAVEETAAGRSDQLKEYVIGVEVYQRDKSFDPRIDAIVRVEAGRLRARLQRYYDTDGQSDPVVISIPKGTYVPVIVERDGTRIPPELSPAGPPDTLSPAPGSPPRTNNLSGFPPFLRPQAYTKIFFLLLVLLGATGVLYWNKGLKAPLSAARAGNPSIAVLPLENLSADPEQEYFSDGMTDALVTHLAKIRGLRVVSRTSSLPYKKAKKSLAEVARELGVEYVVEGTVLRVRNRVRITAQLIAEPDERHVWAESYERDLRDILSLQGEVARAIAREVRVQLTPQDQAGLARAGPVNREAYEAYLKGRHYQAWRTAEGLKQSVHYFQEAVEKDPSYARAYAGLADSYTYLANQGFQAPLETSPLAKAMARKALEIDDTLAEAHTSLAYIRMVYDWDWPGAESEFRRSIDLDPSYTKAHSLFACYFALQKRFDEALVEIRRAVELDPLSIYDNTNLGVHLLMARRFDESIEQFRKTIDLDPASADTHRMFGRTLEQRHMVAEAIAEFQKALVLGGNGPPTLAALAHAYAQAGRTKEVYQVLKQLQSLSNRQYVPSYDLAVVYAALGNKNSAFASLEKACRERDGWLWLWLNVDPRFDDLRPDTWFRVLLSNMHLPH